MDRCPNCDAPVRPNAKFCTGCGFRLPNPEPVAKAEPEPHPDGWRSPFATTSASYEHNQSWTAPVPPPPAPAPAVPPSPPIETAPPVEQPAPVFAGWPNFSTSTIPAGEPADAEPNEAADAVQARDETPTEVTAVGETVSIEDEQPSIEAQAPASHEDAREEESVIAESPAAPDEPAPQPVTVESRGDNPTEPIPVMAAIVKSDIVQRALGLVEELRSLIPSLHATSGSDHLDAAAILANAEAGRPDSDDLSALRTAIETAASRPRDIDVMMDLISRAGAIQELLAERDRYAAAITSALAALDDDPE